MPVPPPPAPTKPYSLLINGVDVISPSGGKGGVPLGSIRWNHNGHNALSTLEFTHEDPAKAFAIPAGAEVQFLDQAHGGLLFGGYIESRELVSLASNQGRAVACKALDYGVLLDRRVMGGTWNSGTLQYDYEIVPSVISYMGVPLGTNVYSTTLLGANQIFSGIPARSIIEELAQLAQGIQGVRISYFVKPTKVLYFGGVAFGFTGPGNVSDVTPTPAGSMPVDNLTLEYDESQVVNQVFVRGASTAASGWYSVPVGSYGQRQIVLDVPQATTITAANRYAAGYLVDHKDATLRGHFEVDGKYCDTPAKHWSSDQDFTITNTALSLSAATFTTYAVETTWQGGNGAHRHTVSFGGLPRSGLGRIIRSLTTAGITPLGSAALPVSGRKILGNIG